MFCAQRHFEQRILRKKSRILLIVFLLFANHYLKLQNKKSIEGAWRQISGSSSQIALSGPTSRSVQSDRSFRTNKSDHPIRSLFQDQQVGASNQNILYRSTSVRANQSVQYGATFRTDQSDPSYGPTFRTDQSDQSYGSNFRTDQSDLSYRPTFRTEQSYLSYGPTSVRANHISPTDLLPYQPIRSLLQTYFRTSQSDFSYGPTSLQSNQIAQTDLISIQANQIARTDLISVWANQIARSFTGQNFTKISSHSHGHRPHEWRAQEVLQLNRHVIERSQIARKGQSELEEEVATRKILTITYIISRSRAAVVLCMHKSLRAHKSLTRKSCTIRTQ